MQDDFLSTFMWINKMGKKHALYFNGKENKKSWKSYNIRV